MEYLPVLRHSENRILYWSILACTVEWIIIIYKHGLKNVIYIESRYSELWVRTLVEEISYDTFLLFSFDLSIGTTMKVVMVMWH